MQHSQFSLSKRLKSFTYAFNGLRILIKEDHNARIHLFATIVVIAAGFFFEISLLEWIAVSFAIGFVIVLEIVNSAIESIADFISPAHDERIKKIKDLAAAAVLVAAITAVVVGVIVFLPKLVHLFQ